MTAPKPAPMFSPRDSQLISKYLVGGAAAGGSAALLTSLINYLSAIKEEQKTDTSFDDDTLYLNLKKKRDKKASVAGIAALSGGVLSALGTYALVRRLYQAMKKKELQAQLDNAQQGYLEVLEADKAAALSPAPEGQRMKAPETIVSLPGALAVILGLASAAVTNKILKKSFPPPKPPARRGPRKVVVRTVDDLEKTAEYKIEDSDETELVLRLLMATKSAGLQEFQDLIAAVGQGRHDEVGHGLVNYGIDTAVSMVKGASANPVAEPYHSMMIGAAALSPLLAPSIELLAAAEFNEHFPSYTKWAAALPEDMQEAFCKIAGVLAVALRSDALGDLVDPATDWDKQAGMGAFMAFDALKDALILHKLNENKDLEKEEFEENVNSGGDISDTSPNEQSKSGPRIVAKDAPSQQFKNKNKDIIDRALAA